MLSLVCAVKSVLSVPSIDSVVRLKGWKIIILTGGSIKVIKNNLYKKIYWKIFVSSEPTRN